MKLRGLGGKAFVTAAWQRHGRRGPCLGFPGWSRKSCTAPAGGGAGFALGAIKSRWS